MEESYADESFDDSSVDASPAATPPQLSADEKEQQLAEQMIADADAARPTPSKRSTAQMLAEAEASMAHLEDLGAQLSVAEGGEREAGGEEARAEHLVSSVALARQTVAELAAVAEREREARAAREADGLRRVGELRLVREALCGAQARAEPGQLDACMSEAKTAVGPGGQYATIDARVLEEGRLVARAATEVLQFLCESRFKDAGPFLRLFERVATGPLESARIAAFNHMAVAHMARGNLSAAMRFARAALRLAAVHEGEVAARATTHLNSCAILSRLGRHRPALGQAEWAERLVRLQLSQGIEQEVHSALGSADDAPPERPKTAGFGSWSSEKATSNSRSQGTAEMLVLALHNIGSEYGYLKRPSESLDAFGRAAETASAPPRGRC